MNKILVIDDNKELLEIAKIKLESKGFEVFLKDNFLDGLFSISNNNMTYDIILLDLDLGGSSGSGYEILNKINDKSKVIIYSNKNLYDDEKFETYLFSSVVFLNKSTNTMDEVINIINTKIDGVNKISEKNNNKCNGYKCPHCDGFIHLNISLIKE